MAQRKTARPHGMPEEDIYEAEEVKEAEADEDPKEASPAKGKGKKKEEADEEAEEVMDEALMDEF